MMDGLMANYYMGYISHACMILIDCLEWKVWGTSRQQQVGLLQESYVPTMSSFTVLIINQDK